MYKLQKGDLLLVKGTHLSSIIIRCMTQSQYSHVAIYKGNGKLIEAISSGVQEDFIMKYNKMDYDIYRHKTATPSDLENMIANMSLKYGTGYDFLGIVGICYYLLTGKENTLDDKTRLWCSEYYADGALSVNLPLDVDSKTHTYSPGDISRDSNIMFICNKIDITL